ncbi:hypothetical protein [Ochrobactrum sp. RH2CCR150]|uniref:hypothetical protein n=1 Tax=Ochrobactrum sp. RH2CCR150 TaxID=2587044 RepID=UPI0015FAF034|nr:hypothetical protein [Ochrobactrum sp. RH2CCR150]
MSTSHGGPAFPSTVEAGEDRFGNKSHVFYRGMTLRDYFAGQALASWPITDHSTDLASKCYALADAMLAARGH